jgi:NAD(P)-dependent dehydrogenase (short-subunit alcohol dehydrogenase family)
MSKTALIAGASRGLGLGLAREYVRRGWQVIATSRGTDKGLGDLAHEADGRLEIEQLDVADPDSVRSLTDRMRGRKLDLVFANAGIAGDIDKPAGHASNEEFAKIMVTNALGPLHVIDALDTSMAADAVVAAMSSGLGSIAGSNGGWELYRASKAALNMMMKSYGARAGAKTVLIIAPGWVRTDMGGPNATLDVETSVRGIADVIERHAGRGGVSYLDYRGNTVAW